MRMKSKLSRGGSLSLCCFCLYWTVYLVGGCASVEEFESKQRAVPVYSQFRADLQPPNFQNPPVVGQPPPPPPSTETPETPTIPWFWTSKTTPPQYPDTILPNPNPFNVNLPMDETDSTTLAEPSTNHQEMDSPTSQETTVNEPTKLPSGAELTTVPSGDELTTVPSGAELTTVPSGADLTTVPSGAEPTTVPSGAELTTIPSGAELTTISSGAELTTVPSGAELTTIPSGAEHTTIPSGADLTTVTSGSGYTTVNIVAEVSSSTTGLSYGTTSTLAPTMASELPKPTSRRPSYGTPRPPHRTSTKKPYRRRNYNLPDGTYYYEYPDSNGQKRMEQGYYKYDDESGRRVFVKQGSYVLMFPDYSLHQFNYIADERGYRIREDIVE